MVIVFETITIQNGGAGHYLPLIEDVNDDERNGHGPRLFRVGFHIDLHPERPFPSGRLLPSGHLHRGQLGSTGREPFLRFGIGHILPFLPMERTLRRERPLEFLASGRRSNCSFADSGTHGLSLKVTDRGGLSAYKNGTVTVLDASPTAMFDASTDSIVEGMSITFVDRSSSPADDLTEFIWDFGDGTVESYPMSTDPTHRYVSNGSYRLGSRSSMRTARMIPMICWSRCPMGRPGQSSFPAPGR